MRLEKETSIYQLGAIAADIGAATTLAKSKNKIFYKDTAPVTGMNEGDLWFKVDSSGGSSLYEYKKTGSNPDTYAWTLRQLGQGSLVAGSVTANEINVNNLSAISGILGSVIVGGLNNEDGVITIKNASDQTIGYWNNTGINATAGAIGGWDISANDLTSTGSNGKITGLQKQTSGVYAIAVGATTMSNWSTAPFRVTHDGDLTATSGKIGNWNIGNTSTTGELNGSLYYGTFGADNSIYLIPAGTTTSKAIAGRTGTDWVITAGANWGVTKTGAMYASGATISGEITATSGKIGPFDINAFSLSAGTMELAVSGAYNGSTISISTTNGSDPIHTTIYPTHLGISVRPGDTGNWQPICNISSWEDTTNNVYYGQLYLGYGNERGIVLTAQNIPIMRFKTHSTSSLSGIYFENSYAETSVIRFLPGSDASGHGVSIGGGGATIIGGGESATACQSLLSTYGDERMIIANDGAIDFYANCQNGMSAANIMTFHAGSLAIRNNNLTKGTNPSAETNRVIVFTDKDGYDSVAGSVLSMWYGGGVTSEGIAYSIFRQYKYAANDSTNYAQLSINYPASGTPYVHINNATLDVMNAVYSTVSSGEAWIQARNSSTGNRIYLFANSSNGQAGIYSADSTNTGRAILIRANNSNAITAYGNWTFDANAIFSGNLYSRRSSSNAWVQAENESGKNAIAIEARTDGTVHLWSRGANATAYDILQRANNSHTITAYGTWTFDGQAFAKGYSGYSGAVIPSTTTDGYRVAQMEALSSNVFHIYGQWGTTGTTYGWRNAAVSSSDIRLKENVVDCTVTALPLINSIHMRAFDWKDGRHQSIGFVADELEELDSKLAIGGGYDADGSMDIKSVDTFYLLGYLVKAVQELSAKVNALEGAL